MQLLELSIYAEERDIPVYYLSMRRRRQAGLSVDDGKNGAVLMNKTLIRHAESVEKVFLAHELGHCETASFYFGANCAADGAKNHQINRCERRAWNWAYETLVPPRRLAYAVKRRHLLELWDLADYFDVPEWFMRRVIRYYKGI